MGILLKKRIKVMITGHRPKKLWGYDLTHPNYKVLYNAIKRRLLNAVGSSPFEMISGMALGVDTQFALMAAKLSREGYPVELFLAIPCDNQSAKWSAKDMLLYDKVLRAAGAVHYVSTEPYSRGCMQDRNKFMVKRCDKAIAVWDGSPGGTGNTVKLIKKANKPLDIIDPNKLFEKEVENE